MRGKMVGKRRKRSLTQDVLKHVQLYPWCTPSTARDTNVQV